MFLVDIPNWIIHLYCPSPNLVLPTIFNEDTHICWYVVVQVMLVGWFFSLTMHDWLVTLYRQKRDWLTTSKCYDILYVRILRMNSWTIWGLLAASPKKNETKNPTRTVIHIDTLWYTLIHIELIYIDTHWYTLIYIDTHWYTLIYNDVHWTFCPIFQGLLYFFRCSPSVGRTRGPSTRTPTKQRGVCWRSTRQISGWAWHCHTIWGYP